MNKAELQQLLALDEVSETGNIHPRRNDPQKEKASMNKWTVAIYHCSCHPDTCNCRRWRLYDPSGEHVASFSDEQDALNLINKIRQFHPPVHKPFIRENRYLVLKWEDIHKYLTPSQIRMLDFYTKTIEVSRLEDGKSLHQFVVIADDWPEYEPVWKMLENRCREESDEYLD